jgi:hypothetical protein
MNIDDEKLLGFLGPQIRDFGGRVEIDTGLWTLFAVPANEEEANSIARSLLSKAGFAHDSGLSGDDQWMLYYVDTANREVAVHWLMDLSRVAAGHIRAASPAQLALINELTESNMPHRIAKQLIDLHTRDELSAGVINDPMIVRALLDRLHGREPLFFSAFQAILENHLLDLAVLLAQLIDEDVGLETEIMKGSLSKDPFLQSRQDAAAKIRSLMIDFHVINAMDQQRNTAITNPYTTLTEIMHDGDRITAHVDGTKVELPRQNFIDAIHTIRRNLYRGGKFESFNTRAPWMSEEIAYSFRFIKQQMDTHRDFSALDWLYMLERAV